MRTREKTVGKLSGNFSYQRYKDDTFSVLSASVIRAHLLYFSFPDICDIFL